MPPIDLKNLAENLVPKDGIWYAETGTNVSYPDSGNRDCYGVEEKSFWFKHRNDCLVEIIKTFPPEGAIFDIGAGNGFVSMAFAELGIDTVVVEPGLTGILNSKKRGLKNLVCSTLNEAGFAPNSMPAIGVFDVIEHIEKEHDFLTDLRSYLRPGGRLYITVPAYQFLWSYEDLYAGHYRRYVLHDLARTLNAIGLKVEFSTYIFSPLPIPVFLFRTLPSWLRLGRHKPVRNNPIDTHKVRPKILEGILGRVFRWELQALRLGRAIPFGGSCLVVGKKLPESPQ